MQRHLVRAVLILAMGAMLIPVQSAGASTAKSPPQEAGAAARGSAQIEEIPISFEVRNVNRSKVPCDSDGRTYTIRGHLIAPAGALRGADHRAVTLYLHGLGFGEFFWRSLNVPGYDYAAAQARAGHASVVIDRLGYDSSDKPAGKDICVGSRADIAHQMVTSLREGSYSADGQDGAGFDRVVLAGHSLGGLIAQAEAYSFGDIDGLIIVGYSDQVSSPLATSLLKQMAQACAADGKPVAPGGPGGYAPFAPPQKAVEALFSNVDPKVLNAVKPRLNIDPCGDGSSFMPAVTASKANVHRIKVPVLVVSGGADALFPPPAGPKQAKTYTASSSVSEVTIADSAHAVTAERTHRTFETTVHDWLQEHARPTGPVAGGMGGAQHGDAVFPAALTAGALLAAAGGALWLRRRTGHQS